MRRIYITPEIECLAKKYAEGLIKGQYLSEKPKDRLLALKEDLESKKTLFRFKKKILNPKTGRRKKYFEGYELESYSKYIEAIITRYDNLNKLHPRNFDGLIKDMETNYPDVDLSVSIRIGKNGKFMSFANHIVKAMDYDGVRDKVFRNYLMSPSIGIKTCVYCNAQYALTTVLKPAITDEIIRKKKGRGRRPSPRPAKLGATYELDHNFPKDKYPYLSTNFYNLQPCCSSCNIHKNNNEINFSVYCWDSEDPAPLHFVLDSQDIIKFREKNKCDGMKPRLMSKDQDQSLANKFNESFSIDAIYSHHSDEVQELLWRHKIYSPSGIEALQASYSNLFEDGFDAERFIFGTYVSENDSHKRPLTIMKQDIMKQIIEEESKGNSIE